MLYILTKFLFHRRQKSYAGHTVNYGVRSVRVLAAQLHHVLVT